jgi:hypothetical protein
MVLGYNWLHHFNPLINWSDTSITFCPNPSGLSLSTNPATMLALVSVAPAMDKVVSSAPVKPAGPSTPIVAPSLDLGPSMDTPTSGPLLVPSGPSLDTSSEVFAPHLFTSAPLVSLVTAAAYATLIHEKDTVQYTLCATPSEEATAFAAASGEPDISGLPSEYHDFADIFSEQEAYNLPLIENSISKLRPKKAKFL